MFRFADHPRSIAVSIFALVLSAILVVTLISFAVTLRGPPPWPAPHSVDAIADALRTGHVPHERGRPMEVLLSATAPRARGQERAAPQIAVDIARRLHVPVADIRAWHDPLPMFSRDAVIGGFTIGQRVGGGWRTVRTEQRSWFTPWHQVTLAVMILAFILLSGPAWLMARALSRPLRRLADTASTARAGVPLGALPQGGASEVRDLTLAVSEMHDRLSRHAEGRTAMLAAIAHDLGTPLSRLVYWIEQLPDAARLRATADIDEMRAMITAALRFARDEAGERSDQRLDLGSLLDSLVEDMAVSGAAVSIETGPRAIVRGDPQALRRLFANLIENAMRYGEVALVSWRTGPGYAEILVDDRGPGFDAAQRERLFEPFVRGDPSRNRETGGTGLGLAIVRSIAEAHEGRVVLSNIAGGGRVTVRLPAQG